jgi:hypothetical protein
MCICSDYTITSEEASLRRKNFVSARLLGLRFLLLLRLFGFLLLPLVVIWICALGLLLFCPWPNG